MAPSSSNETRPSSDAPSSGSLFAELLAGISTMALGEPNDTKADKAGTDASDWGGKLPEASVVALAPALIDALPNILRTFEHQASSRGTTGDEETEQIRASLTRSVSVLDPVRHEFDRRYPGVREDPEKLAESKRALDRLMAHLVQEHLKK